MSTTDTTSIYSIEWTIVFINIWYQKRMRHTLDYFIGLRWRREIWRKKTYENIIRIWMAKQWKMSISKLDKQNIFYLKQAV